MRLLRGNNIIIGTVLTYIITIFEQYGLIMFTFLIFNVLDWMTGTMKARLLGKESSIDGLKGVCKKLGYWVLILVAFLVGENFILIGNNLCIDLSIADYIGWITLAMLVVNEARSIIENLVQMDVYVPEVLVKGLEVAQEKIANKNAE